MIDIDRIVERLANNAVGIRGLMAGLSDEQLNWKPDPETWSLKVVMEHFYNEERLDFRKHLRELLSDPPQPWGKFIPEDYIHVESFWQALDGFLAERAASLAWLKELGEKEWTVSTSVSFGPDHETFILRAGDILFSWVAHDFLHLRQLNELLYAWNEKQAASFSVQYAGGW